jgi:hypothetical protein
MPNWRRRKKKTCAASWCRRRSTHCNRARSRFSNPLTGAEKLCRSPSMALRTNGGILISSKISRSC